MPGPRPTYRGLIVDFGGVLTTSIADAFRAFCEREGLDRDRLGAMLRDSYRTDDPASLVARVEVGAISDEDFERELAVVLSEGLQEPLVAEGLVERMLGGVKPELRMIETVRAARERGTATALLSNSWSSRQYWIDGYQPDELFDAVVISGEVGMRKPDPRIFLLAAERLGLEPADCVFVDDFRENVEAAERVGMHGVFHDDPDRTIPELDRLLPADPV